MKKVRLPHPELVAVVDVIKRNATDERCFSVADRDFCYIVVRPTSETDFLDASYDEDGEIYISHDLLVVDKRVADLCAYHEYLEIEHKRAGRSHAYAHRRAYVAELLAAKGLYGNRESLMGYLQWRIGGYPTSKIPDPQPIVAQLGQVLEGERVRKGDLLKVITEHRL